jgi:hypothetical protein
MTEIKVSDTPTKIEMTCAFVALVSCLATTFALLHQLASRLVDGKRRDNIGWMIDVLIRLEWDPRFRLQRQAF